VSFVGAWGKLLEASRSINWSRAIDDEAMGRHLLRRRACFGWSCSVLLARCFAGSQFGPQTVWRELRAKRKGQGGENIDTDGPIDQSMRPTPLGSPACLLVVALWLRSSLGFLLLAFCFPGRPGCLLAS